MGNQTGYANKKYVPNSFGIVWLNHWFWLEDSNEVIELFDSDDERGDVSNAKKLPREAKLNRCKKYEYKYYSNVSRRRSVKKDVIKDEKGSPEAEII